jgi:uncharacterized protein
VSRFRGWAALLIAVVVAGCAAGDGGAANSAPAVRGPSLPPLTGRVVDGADILPAAAEADLTARLQALETATGRQLVVATTPSLQGYEIEEYGYRLGRAWGIGGAESDDGAILLVAPAEKRVRIEVGYGLEGVLTDALSSRIIQESVLPRFRANDFPGGLVAGTEALVGHLSLPDEQARARVAAAERAPAPARSQAPVQAFLPIIIFVVLIVLMNAGRGGRRRRRRGGGLLIPPVVVWGGGSGGLGGGGWGGGGGFGGGGFSGGGGSFGGGGASGSW